MKAVFDLGTNSVRLLVAEVNDKCVIQQKKEVRITRLGQGVDKTGKLDKAAITRTLDAVFDLASEISPGVPVSIFATSAVRDAKNAREFSQLVEERIGVPLEILSGAEEAQLSFCGAVLSLCHLDLPDPVSVVDVGGGSTEIYSGLQTGKLLGGGSAQVGAVRMLERFISEHPLLSQDRASMEDEIERLLQPLVEDNLKLGPKTLIAVGGTATSIAAMIRDLQVYDDYQVTGIAFSKSSLIDSYDHLARLSLQERREIPSLQVGREDVIVCGAAILVKVAEMMGAEEIVTSAWDLLYGKLVFPVDGGK